MIPRKPLSDGKPDAGQDLHHRAGASKFLYRKNVNRVALESKTGNVRLILRSAQTSLWARTNQIMLIPKQQFVYINLSPR